MTFVGPSRPLPSDGLVGGTSPASAPILLVDNNPAKLLAFKAMLSPLGHRIVEADSGLEALRCLLHEDFAVILLDVQMPVMDGYETAALIRLRAESEMTPIIFTTAYASDEILASDRYAQGAVDFIASPIQPEELRAKVSAFVRLHLRSAGLAALAAELQISSERLKLLTDAAPIGIFQTDAERRYVYTNPRWSEISGMAAEDAIGQPWSAIVDPAQREALAAAEVANGWLDATEYSRRLEIPGPGPVTRIALSTSKAIQDPAGCRSGWVGTLADITAEVGAEAAMTRARDEAAASSKLKSDFLANMSHEIRTPMNGVLGMTDLLLETTLDDNQRDYAQTLRNSGEALLAIIEDILDFSKIEAGRLEVEVIEFEVSAVVDDVLGLLGGLATRQQVALVAVLASSLPELVRGDPGRLRQVLTNLIGNAIKFSTGGEVTVRASLLEPSDAAVVIRFEVADTGVGIAADKLAMIFEPFSQVDTSTTRRYGGTGLGLAISNRLVELMGGKIGVSSEPTKGSTFWFTMPCREMASQSPNAADTGLAVVRAVVVGGDEPSTVARGRSHLGRLLLAEDNVINQKVAVAMLSGAGYEVDTVLNGETAVEASRIRAYDAILMDCQMPELNGYEATAAIRAREGSERHTPIIAVTAGARSEDRERCLSEQMDHYLAKPFSKEALLAVVHRSIHRQPA